MAIAFAAALLVERTGWLLVHSAWQFALIAIVLAVALRLLRHASANARYGAALVGWGLMLAAPVATWLVLPTPDTPTLSGPVPVAIPQQASEPVLPLETAAIDSLAVSPVKPPLTPASLSVAVDAPAVDPRTWSETLAARIAPWLNTLVVIWCAGVCLFGARSARGWFAVQRLLRRDVLSVPDEMTTLLVSVLKRIGLSHRVRLLQSPHVEVPLVVGWLRPVILLPVCVATGFPPQQLEAILAHELAHIRRHDYLINLLQNLSETVFFYHPALWWASAVVRREREHCCDELAARALGDRAQYGRALLALEELRGTTPSLALGAKGGSLLERIRRLAQREPSPRMGAGGVVGIGLVAAVVLTAAVWSAGMAEDRAGLKESNETKSDAPVPTAEEATEGVSQAESNPIGPLTEVSVADQISKYAFDVEFPADHYLWITPTEVPQRRGYSQANIRLRKPDGGKVRVELEFQYAVDEQGTAANPLLSNVDEIQYGWSAPGCEPRGAVSIFGVPDFKRPAADKKIVLVDPASDIAKAEHGTRLLLIIPKDANPQTRAEVEAIQPRGEIIASLAKIEAKPETPADQRLLGLWQSQRNAIGTSHIKYRRFRQGAGQLQALSPAQVAEKFTPGGRQVTRDEALGVLSGLLTESGTEIFGSDWGRSTFRAVGNKSLDVYSRAGQPGDGDGRYVDGEIDIRFDAANRQVDVYEANQSLFAFTDLSDFLLFDRLASLNSIDVERLDNGLDRVTSGPHELIVGSKGFIHAWRATHPTFAYSTYQFEPQLQSGGIVLPGVRMDFQFQNGSLDFVDVVQIDEAHVNEPFAPSDFALSLPAGATLIDHRGKGDQPAFHKVKEEVDDAAAYVRQVLDQKISAVTRDDDTSPPAAAASQFAVNEAPKVQAEWVAKLMLLRNHNQTAFAIGPQMLFELEADEALAVTREAWPQIRVDEVKTGLLKTFEFDRHPHVLEVLDLGATDDSELVRRYAGGYLQNYAFRDFGGDREQYAAWRKETAGKPVLEVLKANAEWFMNDQKSGTPPAHQREWIEFSTMLNIGGTKSSYPDKAVFLRDAGFVELLKKWGDDPQVGSLVRSKSAELIQQIEEAIAGLETAGGQVRPAGEGASRSGDRPQLEDGLQQTADGSPQVFAAADQKTDAEPAQSEKPDAPPYPVILSTEPRNGALDVDPGLKWITVTFDRDMSKGMSWTGEIPNDKSRKAEWTGARTCRLPVALTGGKAYRIGINSRSYRNFASKGGEPTPPTAIYFATTGATEAVQQTVRVPKIVSLKPANGATDVGPALKELKVTFDIPMGDGMSWVGGGESFPSIPEGQRGSWSADKRTCTLPVALQPGHTYRLGLNAPKFQNFKSEHGVPLAPVIYTFGTRN